VISRSSRAVAGELATASELIDFHKDDFAAAYVNEDSTLVVVAATDRGEMLATHAFGADGDVVIERCALSLTHSTDLNVALFTAWPSASDKVWISDINPTGSGIRVGAFKRLDESDRAMIEAFAADHDLHIDIYIDLDAGHAQFL
jgi:hypothetical protein